MTLRHIIIKMQIVDSSKIQRNFELLFLVFILFYIAEMYSGCNAINYTTIAKDNELILTLFHKTPLSCSFYRSNYFI